MLLGIHTVPNTLNEDLVLKCVNEDDAMDKLVRYKAEIKCRLEKRYLKEEGMVRYDMSRNYMEGEKRILPPRIIYRDNVTPGLRSPPNNYLNFSENTNL